MEATCIVCGKEIPKPKSGRASKKYCSTACYQKDYREKNDKILKEKSREKRRIRLEEEWKTKDSIFCAVCGEKIEFSIPQRTIYCSDSCLEKNYLAEHEKRRRDGYRKEYDNNISNKERANKLRRERHPDKKAYSKRLTRISCLYGLTEEDYVNMMDSQKGMCKICKKSLDKISVDHCHTTGIVRGLLCSNCNCAIGLFEEDVSILESAIEYIKTFK